MSFKLLHPTQQNTISAYFPLADSDSDKKNALAKWLYPSGASLTDCKKPLHFLHKFGRCKEINFLSTEETCELIRKDPTKVILRLSSMSGYVTVSHASKKNCDILHTRIKIHPDGVCKPLPGGYYSEVINCRTDGELLIAIYSMVFTDEYTRDSFAVIDK